METAKHVCQRQSTGFTGRQMWKQNRSVKCKTCAQNHSIIFHLPDCPDESRQTGREGFVLMSVLTPPFTTVPHRWPSVQSSTGQGCSPPPSPPRSPPDTAPVGFKDIHLPLAALDPHRFLLIPSHIDRPGFLPAVSDKPSVDRREACEVCRG